MPQHHHIRTDIKYQLLLSFSGLFLVVLLTAFPPPVTGDVPWRQTVIGLIFGIICALGTVAVFSPNKCLTTFSIRNKNRTAGSDSAKLASHGKSDALQGHHPTCGNSSAHVFQVKGRIFCAACVGLLLGALLALAGAVVYFFCDFGVAGHGSLMALLGVVGVSLGLFQFKFRSLARLAMNTLFVLGSFSVLAGIDDLVHSLVFDLFVVSLIAFWLFTRISLSQWDHEVICSGCEVEDCEVRA